jgi:hypothetical protein
MQLQRSTHVTSQGTAFPTEKTHNHTHHPGNHTRVQQPSLCSHKCPGHHPPRLMPWQPSAAHPLSAVRISHLCDQLHITKIQMVNLPCWCCHNPFELCQQSPHTHAHTSETAAQLALNWWCDGRSAGQHTLQHAPHNPSHSQKGTTQHN